MRWGLSGYEKDTADLPDHLELAERYGVVPNNRHFFFSLLREVYK